jgi:methylenetetrahydrofolate dehydrogenase (NADP+)/methenyltetrahydrofolate cyclohydrolase
MTVNGRIIAEDILSRLKKEIEECAIVPHLTVFTYDPNFATNKYLTLKQRKAQSVGITMRVVEFSLGTTTEEVLSAIEQSARTTDGIVLQLPFPKEIDTEALLAAVPPECDVDALGMEGEPLVLSPVVGACEEILNRQKIRVAGKKVLVVGRGRLVGAPAAEWFVQVGGEVDVVDKDVQDISQLSTTADIIVLGAGKPGLLTPEMVKEGVIILDAGTSEVGGELRGDADPACAGKSSLFTPVPGGIGPITIAVLLRNLVTLKLRQ